MKIEYIIYLDGEQSWYQNDKLHREDGPAIIWEDESKDWLIYGHYIKDEKEAVE